jgi:two-component system CheB/CheR fusion protein
MSTDAAKPEENPILQDDEVSGLPFPAVGVGASAGGLEAFRELVSHLKVCSGSRTSTGEETRALRKDGFVFSVLVSLSEMREGGRSWRTCIVHDLSERRELEEENLQAAAAAEQRRIGQELHDRVGQELTGLSLLAGVVLESLEQRSASETRTMTKVVDGLKRSLRLVRELSHGLLPVDLDPEGLRSALYGLVMRVREIPGMHCAFHCSEHVHIEDNAIATHLYRIAQEAVTNSLRHGKPKNIEIALGQTTNLGRVRIQDDGSGIGKTDGQGMGLKMMRHRAELIGGKLHIRRGRDGGTIVTCVFPIHRSE